MQRVACAILVGSGLQAYMLHNRDPSTPARCEGKQEDAALRFVKAQIVFRHGARTPVFPISDSNAASTLSWDVCASGT